MPIEASINQTKSDNLYFVANVTDGKVYYAATQEEHDRNVAEHVNSKIKTKQTKNYVMLHIIFFRKYHQKKVEKNGRKNISYDPSGKGKT